MTANATTVMLGRKISSNFILAPKNNEDTLFPLFLDACGLLFCLKPVNDEVEVGIAGAQASRKPVAAALSNRLTVGDHLKFAGLTGNLRSVNPQTVFNHGHETRDFGNIVSSRQAVNDLNFHFSPLRSLPKFRNSK